MTVAIETHLGSITDTPRRALQLAARVPGLGFTLDYAHFIRVGCQDAHIQPLTACAIHFHARCACKGRLQSSIKDNTIDFDRALRALNKHHFNGWIALEHVWIDWEHCNEVDVPSETVRLSEHLTTAAKKIGSSTFVMGKGFVIG